MIRKITATALAGTAALSTSGCLKSESKTSINSDGSGKFSMTMEMNIAGIMGLVGAAAGGGAAPADMPKGPEAKEMLAQLMRGMNANVDVWTEAKAETTKMGALKVSVAGLTKDWTAMGDMSSLLSDSGLSEGSPLPVPTDALKDFKSVSVSKDSAGNTVIAMAGLDEMASMLDGVRKSMLGVEGAPGPEGIDISRDEIAAQMTGFREQYQSMKGVLALFIKDMKVSTTIETGGTIVEAVGFKKSEDGKSATWTMNGEQLMDVVDSIINDEDMPDKAAELIKTVTTNLDNDKSTEAIKKFLAPYVKEMLGGTTSPRLVIKDAGNSFDYAAEVEKAKAAQSPALKALVEKASRKSSVKLPGSSPAEADDDAKEVK